MTTVERTQTALQNALDAVDAYCGASLDDAKALIRAKVRGLLRGYDARWRDAGYEAESVERTYISDLYNPDTQGKSRKFQMAGKIDVLPCKGGEIFIFDHKTTTQSIDDPNAAYWQQLEIEGQVTQYLLLAHLHGFKPAGAVWDVCRKPGISPKKLSKADRAGAVADRKYCGQQLSMETLTALQTEERENLEMYEARLTHECTVEKPEWYFQRRPVPRMDHQILAYARDVWNHGQDILAARRDDNWPVNPGACMLYNSPCKFLGLCTGRSIIEDGRWGTKQSRHSELPEEIANFDLLTNSRIRCFQTCRRKHYYEYELSIEKRDEETREALFFGSTFHEGVNAWWRTFLREELTDASENSAVGQIYSS